MLDKLESVPGFRTDFTPSESSTIVEQTGCIIAGQSDRIVPADRVLYRLRDTTATVPWVPLIASSIMSKKLAEGLDALVLDLQVGVGVFLRARSQPQIGSWRLAAALQAGIVRTSATITSLSEA